MADGSDRSDLHTATERNRLDFLQADLALCFTFADLVTTELEMGEPEVAQRVLEKAETGYSAVIRFLPALENADQKDEIGRKLNELRARLDSLQLRFHP